MTTGRRRNGVENKSHNVIPHSTAFQLEIDVNEESIYLQIRLNFDQPGTRYQYDVNF